ncbi:MULTISPECIES: hypothetical protein [Methanobacterium]|jgi:hypothetical protein|uniref:Uncharacterized protein n=1 Tax=Methanobacterium veterum TaxID=408577 RepID=A0A9E5DQM9_9EURY|nr:MULTISPECIES: hypothetical protein [Methanobacterium]MCZ3367159.1 hypothetical protein [Methanobacterium veterum]MCZ3373693.1 hypothetical protein [Methanobacterium veterum]
MESSNKIESINIKKQLKKLERESGDKNTCIAWVKFPYSKSNLKLIKESLKELNWNRKDYRLTYDENIIFIDKELL